jgi:hypothetical protein
MAFPNWAVWELMADMVGMKGVGSSPFDQRDLDVLKRAVRDLQTTNEISGSTFHEMSAVWRVSIGQDFPHQVGEDQFGPTWPLDQRRLWDPEPPPEPPRRFPWEPGPPG